jgi:hypothetical protein
MREQQKKMYKKKLTVKRTANVEQDDDRYNLDNMNLDKMDLGNYNME